MAKDNEQKTKKYSGFSSVLPVKADCIQDRDKVHTQSFTVESVENAKNGVTAWGLMYNLHFNKMKKKGESVAQKRGLVLACGVWF